MAAIIFLGSGCGIVDAVGDLKSKAPINNGFQVNNISTNIQAEGWLNGDITKATIDPDERARFGVGFNDSRYVEATLTVALESPSEDGSIQVVKRFRERSKRVVAITVEDNDGEPSVCVKEGGRKECRSPKAGKTNTLALK